MVVKGIEGDYLKILGFCALNQEKYGSLERAQDTDFFESEIYEKIPKKAKCKSI